MRRALGDENFRYSNKYFGVIGFVSTDFYAFHPWILENKIKPWLFWEKENGGHIIGLGPLLLFVMFF